MSSSAIPVLVSSVQSIRVTSSYLAVDRTRKAAKPERLFRSAVSAYCALVRPSRSEAAQFDDLTLPLLPLVSPEGRRFAAAALSEMGPQPTALVRRLAEEPLEISAPLLTRSVNLSDVDLIGLIGRHGVGHAQAIGRRPHLNANIAKLVKTLGAIDRAGEEAKSMKAAVSLPEEQITRPDDFQPVAAQPVSAAEEVRVQLREMMRPASPAAAEPVASPLDWDTAAAAYPKLLSNALAGSDAFFHTALADALNISFGAAQMLDDDDAPGLTTVLKALDLPVEQAFLVATLVYPYGMVGHDNVRAFVSSYRKTELVEARDTVLAWRERNAGKRAAIAHDWEPIADKPANDAGTGIVRALRAS